MSTRDLVSVITPAFNASAYLPATIESCLAQTHASLELLVVDDGSTDDTAEIARHYAASDSRVRVFRIPNSGVAAARNVAIQFAQGEVLALLDSDDLWMPDYLEQQLRTLSGCPGVDVVTANALNLGGPCDGQALWPASSDVRPISLLDMIVREDAIHIFAVFRRAVFDRAGGFDKEFRGNEDYHFWLRAAVAGCHFLADFTPRGYYRRRPDSASADERRMLAGILRVFSDVRPRCPAGSELQALDAQVRRFTTELLIAEARERVLSGDPVAGLQCLARIPPTERSAVLSILLAVGGVWPPLLSGSYRTKRTVGKIKRRLSRHPAVRSIA